MKICIFPNDPLLSYYQKGEIKDRYFNPKNFFEEVHVISLFDEEVEEEKVISLAGNAKLKIHRIGKVNLANYKSFQNKISDLINNIKPRIIRSYNPLIQGWLSIKAGKKLGIPVVVSIHTNYDQQRKLIKDEKKYLKFLKSKFSSEKIERYVIKNSDATICVYEFIVPYAKKMEVHNIHVIYNRVDLNYFSPCNKKELSSLKPIIISVGRLINQKNHKYLIHAIKSLDVKLLIIGSGPNYQSIKNLIESLEVEDKVQIIESVPNKKMVEYYTSSTIYAQPMENLGGIPIPVLEAMACGLPVVMSKRQEGYSEIIDDAIVFVENDPKSFENAFVRILQDSQHRESLKKKSLQTVQKISGDIMEEKELTLYKDLMKI